MKLHWETLYACDFFSVEVLGISGTVRYMVFFVIEIKTWLAMAISTTSLRTSLGLGGRPRLASELSYFLAVN